jgi:flagellar basal-body rod protein FlgF
MENALLIGLSRQMALQRELNVVANNVANINTPGFKAEAVMFEEYLMPGARHDDFRGRDRRLSYVQDRATWHDMGQGPVKQTGNPLDVALGADQFLVVQTPRGERYTRNGAMQINAQGQLVTAEGYQVMGDGGAVQFQSEDREITIARDGTVSVPLGARGRLRVVSFADAQQLRKDGMSTFAAPAGAQPQVPQNIQINQGNLEESNVRGVVEMSRMIEVSRNYTQIASLLQQQSEIRKNTIERLAEVPA